MSLQSIISTAIEPALSIMGLPMKPEATVLLLAIGLQESRFTARRQLVGKPPLPIGPAKSYWQGEEGGGMVQGVRTHKASRDYAAKLYASQKVVPINRAIWNAIEHNDVLAAGLARLLLLTDPNPLPDVDDEAGAWTYYVKCWRPGKPHAPTWPEMHRRAREAVA